MPRRSPSLALIACFTPCMLFAQQHSAKTPANVSYHIYAGNTHAHTSHTWSHGEQWAKNGCAGVLAFAKDPSSNAPYSWSLEGGGPKKKAPCYSMYVMDGFQYPTPDMKLKSDWQKVQGPPSVHYAAAKAKGFDFYVTSDHSQEAAFQPVSPDNPMWAAAKKEARDATDKNFVAINGFEFSENNGPGGVGHLNVMNSNSMLNALVPGVDLPFFYKWLASAKPNGEGPVVASFNHPGPHQYADFADRTPAATDIITMLEVINSNKNIHYPAFINALDKGWKVSPVSGNDNHGLTGIQNQTSRTFVLATGKTKVAILDAMKHRRTYASLDNNIQCRYTVNNAIMGSTLARPGKLKFHISISDPDTSNPNDKITRIDIVKDGGGVAQTFTPDTPGYTVEWSPTLEDTVSKYFFVRVWNAGGGDAPGADPEKPIAWLAPVWTGR
jgi:hypothetical protein